MRPQQGVGWVVMGEPLGRQNVQIPPSTPPYHRSLTRFIEKRAIQYCIFPLRLSGPSTVDLTIRKPRSACRAKPFLLSTILAQEAA